MTLLTSQIPILYCMLYYRSGRPNNQRSTESYPMPFRQLSEQGTDGAIRSDFRLPERNLNQFRPFPGERHWTFHRQHRDLDKLCSNVNLNDLGSRTGHSGSPGMCSLNNPGEIRQVLPSRFMSEHELRKMLPQLERGAADRKHRQMPSSVSRFVANPHKHADLKFDDHGDPHCGTCLTEVGYEVLTEVTDFKGDNHTVINFNNAYQFIPAGRCLSENSPCGGGENARCKQVYRAHWTLVWAAELGVRLAAHEVPSHCECLNIGGEVSIDVPPMSPTYVDSSTHGFRKKSHSVIP